MGSRGVGNEKRDVEISGVFKHFQATEVFPRPTGITVHVFISHCAGSDVMADAWISVL